MSKNSKISWPCQFQIERIWKFPECKIVGCNFFVDGFFATTFFATIIFATILFATEFFAIFYNKQLSKQTKRNKIINNNVIQSIT